MNTKRILGMLNAPKQKRYKSFCVQVADTEEVWLMQDKVDVPVLQQNNICVWPDKAFVSLYQTDAIPVMMEIHDFMDACSTRIEKQDFIIHVFPSLNDSCDVPASQLLESINEELELVE